MTCESYMKFLFQDPQVVFLALSHSHSLSLPSRSGCSCPPSPDRDQAGCTANTDWPFTEKLVTPSTEEI